MRSRSACVFLACSVILRSIYAKRGKEEQNCVCVGARVKVHIRECLYESNVYERDRELFTDRLSILLQIDYKKNLILLSAASTKRGFSGVRGHFHSPMYIQYRRAEADTS